MPSIPRLREIHTLFPEINEIKSSPSHQQQYGNYEISLKFPDSKELCVRSYIVGKLITFSDTFPPQLWLRDRHGMIPIFPPHRRSQVFFFPAKIFPSFT